MTQNQSTHFRLKQRSEIHWARKIWHMTTVFAMFMLYQLLSKSTCLALLGLGVVIFIGGDLLRQRYKGLNEFAIQVFGPVMRQSEAHKFAGTSFLILGVTLIVAFFPHEIVSLTLLFLCFADPLASYVGIRFGREKILGNKTLQGFLAAFVTCMLCSYIYLTVQNYTTDRLFIFCLLAGLLGALAELVPIAKIDDNLSLPIVSATGLYVLFYFFGFFV